MREEGEEAQDWQSRRSQPAEGDTTVRGLNIAGVRAGRAGASEVRAMRDGAQSPPLGGAGWGGGTQPRRSSPPAVRRVGADAEKGAPRDPRDVTCLRLWPDEA